MTKRAQSHNSLKTLAKISLDKMYTSQRTQCSSASLSQSSPPLWFSCPFLLIILLSARQILSSLRKPKSLWWPEDHKQSGCLSQPHYLSDLVPGVFPAWNPLLNRFLPGFIIIFKLWLKYFSMRPALTTLNKVTWHLFPHLVYLVLFFPLRLSSKTLYNLFLSLL